VLRASFCDIYGRDAVHLVTSAVEHRGIPALGGHPSLLAGYVQSALERRPPTASCSSAVSLSTNGLPLLSLVVSEESTSAAALCAAPSTMLSSGHLSETIALDDAKVTDWAGGQDSDDEDIGQYLGGSADTGDAWGLKSATSAMLTSSAFDDQQFLFVRDAVVEDVVS
jgi:hypothetical protein